jgi:hypothetical protein
LTGDADEALPDLDQGDDDHLNSPDVIYVIGGIVDRNRFPKAAYDRAIYLQQYFDLTHNDSCFREHRNEAIIIDSTVTASVDNSTLEPHRVITVNGKNDVQDITVKVAKLPIKEYISSMKTTPILTCLHVMEILLEYKLCKDWKVAFQKVLPPRKGAQYYEDEDYNGAK